MVQIKIRRRKPLVRPIKKVTLKRLGFGPGFKGGVAGTVVGATGGFLVGGPFGLVIGGLAGGNIGERLESRRIRSRRKIR